MKTQIDEQTGLTLTFSTPEEIGMTIQEFYQHLERCKSNENYEENHQKN